MAKVDEVINSLEFHKLDPLSKDAEKMDLLRRAAIGFAEVINVVCPESREQSLAYTHLEESLMWAIKSIAIRM